VDAYKIIGAKVLKQVPTKFQGVKGNDLVLLLVVTYSCRNIKLSVSTPLSRRTNEVDI
jgi:hypothetical protein